MNTVLEWLSGVALRQQINRRVAARTRDIAVESNRIATVLRGANMHFFFQDRELRYKSVISPQRNDVGIELLGRTDEQVLTSTERESVIATKKNVIATGEADECDMCCVM